MKEYCNKTICSDLMANIVTDQWSRSLSDYYWKSRLLFDFRSGQTKYYKIGIRSFPGSLHRLWKTGWQVAAWLEDWEGLFTVF